MRISNAFLTNPWLQTAMLGLLLSGPWTVRQSYSQQDQPAAAGLELRAREFLEMHCLDCHGHDEPEAGLDLAHFRSLAELRLESDIWEKVMRRVKTGSMPPADYGIVDDDDKQWFANWVDDALHRIDCGEVLHPGVVTIRRLNRLEFRNSIRDLLGVDYEPAMAFPGDDTGYGFDNIGDVLSLPPVLLEKYLAAAEFISRQVIEAPEDIPPLEVDWPLNKWSTQGGVNKQRGLAFYSNGSATWQQDFNESVTGVLRIRARGDQAGDEPVVMNVQLGKRRLRRQKIVEHDQVQSFEIPITLGKGPRELTISFENDYYEPEAADPSRRDRNLIVENVTFVQTGQQARAPSEQHQRFFFIELPSGGEERDAARKLISVWASRFFRRPCSESEVDRLYEIYRSAREDNFSCEKSMQFALQAIMLSPKFLYKVERPAPADGSVRALTSFELATNLSYFLWSTTPDDALLQVALQSDLQEASVLQAETERMLHSEKADQLISSFAVQWLQLRGLESMEPDPQLFPGVDRELLRDMRKETELFCREILREDRSLLDFIQADFTFVNGRLARHYGISPPPVTDDQFVKVDLSGTQRGGLLTQGSILTVTSNPTRTSPVKRGKWILENLLGEPPPPALPEVMPLEQQELTGNLRQRMEQHRTDPACASCHQLMDPLGFSLENFDAVGRWRTEDEGSEIDASGDLPSGESFAGPAGLREILLEKKKQEFIRCFTEQMLIYALGRGLRYEDQCTVNQIVERLRKNDYRFSELIFGIVESPPFRQRQQKVEEN